MSTRSSCPTLFAAGLATAVALTAQSGPSQPRLLRDIGPPVSADSQPSGFTTLGPWCYFAASSESTGRELYRTLGRPGTTELVLDLAPGSEGSNPTDLVSLGSRLAFVAAGSDETNRLFVTDGTAAGTRTLDIGAPRYRPVQSLAVGGRVVLHFDGPDERELWVSDGTADGTGQVRHPGLDGQRLGAFTPARTGPGGTPISWFLALLPGGISDVWITDGTGGGTRRVARLPAGSGGALLPLGPDCSIVDSTPPASPTSQLLVTDLVTGTVVSLPTGANLVGSRPMVFDGRAVYPTRTPGIPAVATDGIGVTAISVTGAATFDQPRLLGVAGGALWLVSDSGNLASLQPGSDTAVVVGTAPVPTSVTPGPSAARIGTRLYYSSGLSLVEMDAGTARTRTLAGSSGVELAVHGGNLLFANADWRTGREPWRHDPRSDVTEPIADIALATRQTRSDPFGFQRYGERVVFTAWSPDTGGETWITDGTTAGTRQLAEFVPGTEPVVSRTIRVGDELWIIPFTDRRTTIHRSDGTRAGTRPLVTLDSGRSEVPPVATAAALGTGIVFIGRVDGVDGAYRVDSSGTVTLLVQRTITLPQILANGDTVFFGGSTPARTITIWRTDGTVPGTFDLSGGAGPEGLLSLARFDDRLWAASGGGIYVSDRAATLLTRVDPMVGAELYVTPHRLFALTINRVASTTSAAVPLSGLGTAFVTFPKSAAPFGDRLLYVAANRPWITDGTQSGTIALRNDVYMQERATAFHVAGPDRAWFAADASPQGPTTLFETDGRPGGTRRVTELPVTRAIVTPLPGSNPVAVAGGRLYMNVRDPEFGNEPFVLDLDAAAESVGRACTADPTRDLTLAADTTPRIGRSTRISGRASGATGAALVVGWPATRPALLTDGRGCAIEVEPATAFVTDPIAVSASGAYGLPLTVPASATFVGITLMLQPVVAPGSGSRSYDVGPALRLLIGR